MVRGTGHGRRLGAQGRGAIAAGLARGDSLASIARFLGVAVSTVSREVAAGGGRQAYGACQVFCVSGLFRGGG
ncbi:helix-turn-helix domain-containing protein [Actinomyces howellii]